MLSIFKQIPCVAPSVPCVGDQIIHMIDHIPIGPDNSKSAWDLLHARWVEGIIKSMWQLHRSLRWMIGDQHGQSYFRVLIFCSDYRFCCHAIKASVISYDEFRDTKIHYVLLHNFG